MTDNRTTTNVQLRIACSSDITGFLVSFDGGRNGLQSTRYRVRRDTRGRVTARVPYNVYRDPARSGPYEPQIPESIAVDGRRGGAARPFFGVVNGRVQSVPAGTICLASPSTGDTGRMAR